MSEEIFLIKIAFDCMWEVDSFYYSDCSRRKSIIESGVEPF